MDLSGPAEHPVHARPHELLDHGLRTRSQGPLFASDGGGIPYRDSSFASANTNFTQYMESLEKMKPLAVDYLCADHYGYVTGEDAGGSST